MKNNLNKISYNSNPQLRHPLRLLISMWQDLFSSKELAWRLFLRNISSMYRQTMLGYVWAFLPPLATTFTFVFLNKAKIFTIGATDIPYPAYVMIGTLLWQGFADAINSPIRAINQAKSFLTKMNFPREAIILAGIAEVIFNFMIRLVLFIVVIILYKISLPATALLAPLGIITIIALGLMIGVLLAPIGVLFQDIEKALPLVLSMWMLLTPVVYPPPTTWPISLLSSINPISSLLITTREMLTSGIFTNLFGFLVISISTIILLFIGWMIFRLALPHLIERINI